MLGEKHKSFFPPSANCTLWRYIDFTKFLSLLENRCLFFSRVDQFDDPYEGALSRAGVEFLRNQIASVGGANETVDYFINVIDSMRQQVFINCWFMSEHESAAMWKLYLQSPEGVAIRTDHDTLAATLDRSPLKVRTTMVKYVDYDKVPIPPDNAFFPFVYKRLNFAHETELRAIIWSNEDINKTQVHDGAMGVTIDVESEEFIKSVHVSPNATKWFGQLVEQVLRRYNLSIPVVRSSLYDRPSY
ncbi:MAG: hypothetical protein JXL20_10770 [Deltaproteobacteria bacterium]|nr:hypothetical protein [Deltaproteobacteria bacterium]